LNLPEVEEEDASVEQSDIPELPVLYPEIEEDSDDDAEDEPETDQEPETDDEPGTEGEVGADDDFEDLIVSEWPDPVESGG
jgi:hypothetical protein